MEIRVKMTVSTDISLSSEADSKVSSLISWFLLLWFVFFPLFLSVSSLEWIWVERKQNHMQH